MTRRDFTLPLFERPALLNVDPPNLRPYQADLIDRLRKLVLAGKKRILVVGPCSMGKMVCIAAIFKSSTLKNLFVAHRFELINQCASQLERFGISQYGVIRADDERTDTRMATQIASIQTLDHRDRPDAGLISIDEAHLSAADRYKRLVFEAYPDAIIFGWTATPARLAGEPLGDFYEHMEVACSYEHLLKNPKWLVAPIILGPPQRIDTSGVKCSSGEFDEAALAAALDRGDLIGNAAEHWAEWAHRHPVVDASGQRVHAMWQDGPRRTSMGFAVSIDHSMHLCARFEKLGGVRVAHLDGKTKEVERKRITRGLETGDLDFVWNVNVLQEGFDCPRVKCIVHCRPTMSLVQWRQSTQRGMRPWEGVVPLLLDHGGNMERHFAPHEDIAWSLTTKPRRHASTPNLKECTKCHAYVTVGRHLCPTCGQEFPVETRQGKTVGETADKLQTYASTPEAMRTEFFEKQLLVARTKGFKAGYASAKFFERYGVWPPRDWGERAKREFASDVFWQGAYANNQARREAKKAHEEAEEAAMAATPAADGNAATGQPEAAEADPWGLADDFSSYLETEGIR